VIKHFLSKQFIQFVAVGLLAALLHWLARIVLSAWMPFSWAVVCAYVVGMAVAFMLNRRFVFPASLRPLRRQARDFVLVNLAFLPIVFGAAILLNRALGWIEADRYREAVAHGIAVAVPMLITFLIYKFFTFKDVRYGSA